MILMKVRNPLNLIWLSKHAKHPKDRPLTETIWHDIISDSADRHQARLIGKHINTIASPAFAHKAQGFATTSCGATEPDPATPNDQTVCSQYRRKQPQIKQQATVIV